MPLLDKFFLILPPVLVLRSNIALFAYFIKYISWMLSTRSFIHRSILFVSVLLVVIGCRGENSDEPNELPKEIKYTRFKGSYKSFNDLHDLHLSAAKRKGITPMQNRGDTINRMDQLVKLPLELDTYKIDKLKYSVPFLVSDASKLLVKIGLNFKDSLQSKKLPRYKIIVTSITRTLDDVESLTKRNSNASDNSAHCFGTTFDISWRRFEKIGPSGKDDVGEAKLKLVLAEVLHDLRERKECYIVHERKQACFHITVR